MMVVAPLFSIHSSCTADVLPVIIASMAVFLDTQLLLALSAGVRFDNQQPLLPPLGSCLNASDSNIVYAVRESDGEGE